MPASIFQESYLFTEMFFSFSLLIDNILHSFPRHLYFHISVSEYPCSLPLGALENDSVSCHFDVVVLFLGNAEGYSLTHEMHFMSTD